MNSDEFTILGNNTIKKLLNSIKQIEDNKDEKIAIHIKFQKQGLPIYPTKLPNKLVVIYDDNEENTPTCFDDYPTAKSYISSINKDPYRIDIKLTTFQE